MYEFHLFAGAGGGILGGMLAGKYPIGAVEIEDFPRKVLAARQNDGSLPQFPIWDDVRTFEKTNNEAEKILAGLRTIRNELCISGGFPCQDISAAGKGAGANGSRSGLWREFLRIVQDVQPSEVFLENSPLIMRRGGNEILQEFAKSGYDLAWIILSAGDVGAPHERKRWWCLGISHAHRARCEEWRDGKSIQQEVSGVGVCGGVLPHPDLREAVRRQRSSRESEANENINGRRKTGHDRGERRKIKPQLGRISNGVAGWMDKIAIGKFWDHSEQGIPRIIADCPNRRDRLKAIGNGQVPLCAAYAYLILKEMILDVENL